MSIPYLDIKCNPVSVSFACLRVDVSLCNKFYSQLDSSEANISKDQAINILTKIERSNSVKNFFARPLFAVPLSSISVIGGCAILAGMAITTVTLVASIALLILGIVGICLTPLLKDLSHSYEKQNRKIQEEISNLQSPTYTGHLVQVRRSGKED